MKAGKQSAGILLYRRKGEVIEFFLVHPGGPFWAKKDAGAWSIPKGEFTGEEPLQAAKREFAEETGTALTATDFIALIPVKLKSGKMVHAWIAEGDIDETMIKSNYFDMEWPQKSGKTISIPEIDKAGWFDITKAVAKINSAQAGLIQQANDMIKNDTLQ